MISLRIDDRGMWVVSITRGSRCFVVSAASLRELVDRLDRCTEELAGVDMQDFLRLLMWHAAKAKKGKNQ